MKKFFCVILFLCSASIFGQTAEFCHPNYIKNISTKIIDKLTTTEIQFIQNSTLQLEKNWLNENEQILNNRVIINYSDFLPILEYARDSEENLLSEFQLERIFLIYALNKIQEKNTCVSTIIDKIIEWSKENKKALALRIEKDSINGKYIPTDLNDAIKHLDLKLADEFKSKIKLMTEEQFTVEGHIGIGLRVIRNGWELWGKSRLSNYFENLGIDHPDTMSGIILTSYYRQLIGEPIDLESQIKEYQNRLRKNPHFTKKEFPINVKDVEFDGAIGYPEFKEQKEWPSVSFFRSINGEITWIYSYKFGWKQLTKEQLVEFDKISVYEIQAWLEHLYKSG
ncbi:hypothetical protein G5B37_03395 [Rasiella rasia]|uniref:DUF6794 domain-containing protein n=1 Tax=Rasiella rasia TaxID=2744027 RepID=A0A6G6GJD5_9FLAO|nr:DUF6794 domain-containing protein [Rasiella rasia]QIE58637.1 hypothetical protein G5B37_03395 [Rasiella rasia]